MGKIQKTQRRIISAQKKGNKQIRTDIRKGVGQNIRNVNAAAGMVVKDGRKNARQIMDNQNIAAGNVIKRLSSPLFHGWNAFVAIFLFAAGIALAAWMFYMLADAGTAGFVIYDRSASPQAIVDGTGNVMLYEYPMKTNYMLIWVLATVAGVVPPAIYLAIRAGWCKLKGSSS